VPIVGTNNQHSMSLPNGTDMAPLFAHTATVNKLACLHNCKQSDLYTDMALLILTLPHEFHETTRSEVQKLRV
jgi:hypothetical protein